MIHKSPGLVTKAGEEQVSGFVKPRLRLFASREKAQGNFAGCSSALSRTARVWRAILVLLYDIILKQYAD